MMLIFKPSQFQDLLIAYSTIALCKAAIIEHLYFNITMQLKA